MTVAAAHPDQRYVTVGSVDGTGRFSPFYPANLDGHSVTLPALGQPLGPPIVLDAAPGPERIVVVRSARPLSVAAVAAQVVVGVDASKLDQRATARCLSLDRIDMLVTDLEPEDRRLDPYRELVSIL